MLRGRNLGILWAFPSDFGTCSKVTQDRDAKNRDAKNRDAKNRDAKNRSRTREKQTERDGPHAVECF